MIEYKDIKKIHLEISSFCNASCPWCPRNFWGYPYNSGYPEANLTLDQAKKIFQPSFLQQLDRIYINGNFGDIVMNPDGLAIVKYFFEHNHTLDVTISTNGSARDKQFWTALGQTNATVLFCIDGLEDTHHLYRQNTVWKTILKNAKTFIQAGGRAVWKFIKFKHNKHQIDECKNLSAKLGFHRFELVESTRVDAPVFDKQGNLSHILGDYRGETNFEILFYKKRTDLVLLEDIIPDRKEKKQIRCGAQEDKEIYITSTGEVYPCCFTGFYPKTFGHGQYHQAANAQLKEFIKKNNALEYDLTECIKWFQSIQSSWDTKSFKEGRLVICNDNCGI
jgi:MoaA/NifB/PqqE/SkfB family radical SAM enzyme